MIWQTHLTSQFQLNWWAEEQNNIHQPITKQNHERTGSIKIKEKKRQGIRN
jgi:hypothetical protein